MKIILFMLLIFYCKIFSQNYFVKTENEENNNGVDFIFDLEANSIYKYEGGDVYIKDKIVEYNYLKFYTDSRKKNNAGEDWWYGYKCKILYKENEYGGSLRHIYLDIESLNKVGYEWDVYGSVHNYFETYKIITYIEISGKEITKKLKKWGREK